MIDVPIISSAVYPKMRSAPEFQLVTIRFKSFPTIASSDEATRAAKRLAVISELMALGHIAKAPYTTRSCSFKS